MMKAMSRVMVTAAAASLAFAPIAVQANTRASDNAPVYNTSSQAQPGMGRTAAGEEVKGAPGILVLILGVAAAVGGIVAVSDDADDSQSPGT